MRAITGACGFMALFQQEAAASVGIPAGLPGLLRIPMIHALCGGRVGIMTADSRRLTDRRFAASQVREDIPPVICGMEGCDQFRTLEEKGKHDSAAIKAEVLGVAARMQAQTPDLRAILQRLSLTPSQDLATWLSSSTGRRLPARSSGLLCNG